MPNDELTIKDVGEEVATLLGQTGVDIELAEADYLQGLKQALRVYNRNRPVRRREALSVTQAQKKYEIDRPGLLGVVGVQFLSRIHEIDDPFDPFFNTRVAGLRTGLTLTGDTFGEYDQKLQYIEQARRIASSEPEWHGQWEKDLTDPALPEKYFLYVDVATFPMQMSFAYTVRTTPDNSDETGMQHIPHGDVEWVIAYVLASCMISLGRIRAKHGGIVGPDGGVQEVDGRELITDGQEALKELVEEIKQRRRPLQPDLE
jgi:hypothetical protein